VVAFASDDSSDDPANEETWFAVVSLGGATVSIIGSLPWEQPPITAHIDNPNVNLGTRSIAPTVPTPERCDKGALTKGGAFR
jgi:hypothetical protein